MSRIYTLDPVPRRYVPRPNLTKQMIEDLTDDELEEVEPESLINMADILIREYGDKPKKTGSAEQVKELIQMCSNLARALRRIHRVGISRRIIELESIKRKYATPVS